MKRALLCFALACSASAQSGPDTGALVVAGGGVRSPAIYKKFADLAGGFDQPIVVIPTAGGAEDYGPDWDGLRRFREAGFVHITLLHTYDRAEADTEAFAEPIRRTRGVWFTGGRQWRLADSYLDTRTHDELRRLLERGGVIGGSSAGATIQGEYLARGDTSGNTIMMGDHEQGLGFIEGVAIDQHLLARNRQFDLLEILNARPDLLGIGIDEDTAIVVQGDAFEVIGSSYVAVYDRDDPRPFVLLGPGEQYDLARRAILQQTHSP